MSNVGVIGATGRLGQRIVLRLRARGTEPIVFGRDPAKLEALSARHARRFDLDDADGLRGALQDVDVVINAARPRMLAPILTALPSRAGRIVAVGSTRKFTRFPDRAAEMVREAETALAESGRPGLMLHPTMIYGEQGEKNIQRLLAWIRRVPVVPLPAGGRTLVQPVYVDDVAEAVARAALLPDPGEGPLVIAGPAPMTYAEMVRCVGRSFGHRIVVLPVPFSVVLGGAALSRRVPGLPRFKAEEVRRLLEDKDFDVEPMRRRLGLEPIAFDEGLARMRQYAPGG
ncbi:MAG: NAD(P)H-binding protein [Alphaproteobacteria bacterium]